LEHGLRTAMLALRMAQAMGLPQDDQVTVYYTGLLHFAGCTAESEIDARFFADLKSMWTAGHSRGVADLAERGAGVAGLAATEVVALRRAALVHDIGRVAVPVSVWAKPGPLTLGEHEQVRLHAYHSERVLDVCPALRPPARLAGSHGERCDGSGYHRGSRAGQYPYPGPPDCPSASARCSASSPAAWPPSRQPDPLAPVTGRERLPDSLLGRAVVVARRFTCLTGGR
jgi:HD-GYP domain-containing protein (c-di-GMP phosphodiesterase class II)